MFIEIQQLLFNRAVQLIGPLRHNRHVWRKRPQSKINGTENDNDITNAGRGGEDKQVFDSLVANGKAADRAFLPMDHYIRPESRPAIGLSSLPILLIGIIKAQSEMVKAVRIKRLNMINSLGNLFVSLLQLWAESTTHAKDRIVLEMTPITSGIGHPHFKLAFSFESNESKVLRRVGNADPIKGRSQPCPNRICELRNAVGNGLLPP